jgi:hypothetical protein
MGHHTVHLGVEETVDIVLPDGKKVHVQLSCLDSDQWPEVDIWLDRQETFNLWRDGQKIADHDADQVIIPIPIEGHGRQA